ncbi:MAG: hypothetical protein ABJB61_10555 [bacterium]
MIKHLCLLLIALALAAYSISAQSSPLELPPEARGMLYLKFPDWRYAEISDEVRQALKQYNPPNLQPDLISGDFDGDCRPDYAALIVHGVTRVEHDEIVSPDFTLVIFMAHGHSYQLYTIDNPGGEYIALIQQGDKGYNYELQEEFNFEHDAIDAVIFEKAATSYVYESGHFRAIITGD